MRCQNGVSPLISSILSEEELIKNRAFAKGESLTRNQLHTQAEIRTVKTNYEGWLQLPGPPAAREMQVKEGVGG